MKMSAFFGHNIARGSGGGGGGDGGMNPKANKKLSLEAESYGTYCLEGLFHTVPSSFVLYCSTED